MKNYLQKIGRSLMVPVAVLPAAAILMGIGYWIVSVNETANFFSILLLTSGNALIGNMGLLFAIGIAYGMSKDKDGSAAITGLVGWLIVQGLLAPETLASFTGVDVSQVDVAFSQTESQFIGILIGIISAEIYNLTYQVKLPDAFSFFSGRRLSAIVNSGVMILVAGVLAVVWPTVYDWLVTFGEFIQSFGNFGAGLFGFFNRMLLPLGLHHALNSVFWFDVAGINDIPNYLSGDGTPGVTGIYQAGFFPIMMFGLPASALAMYHEAKDKNKKIVAGLLLGGAVASFFTGVTEPFEFTFMFLAPMLFFAHAVLTGISLFVSATFQWIAGFGFSAGVLDYILSFKNPLAINNYMLIVQGIVFAIIYYILFRFAIRKFNLMTPGRADMVNDENNSDSSNDEKYTKLATEIIELIGIENLEAIDHCTTRLRLTVKDSSIYEDEKFTNLGALGVVKPGPTSLQIIIGTDVQFVADELKSILNS